MSPAEVPDVSSRDAGVPVLPIRTVSALTGVSAFTLRAWERRYGLVVPQRTENGQRVYTQSDVDLIRRILAMVDSGVAIGRVASALESSAGAEIGETTESSGFWGRLLDRMVDRIAAFDEQGLDHAYQDALALHPIEQVTESLLVPLLRVVGERWLRSPCGIAEEHFFAIYMRNKLGARFHHRRIAQDGKRLLCACIPGERHELGQLLFALAAHDRGYRPVLLGADVPTAAVAAAASRLPADAIVLSASFEASPGYWADELRSLVEAVTVPVFLGGTLALTHSRQIVEAGAHDLGCDLNFSFRRIAEVMPA